jgi:hypothetical protein
MNIFTKSILKVFKGAFKAFQTFPVTIASALAFSIVTIIRIHLDWPQQEAYNFLFNCLHWSFALGAIFSLATITAAKSRYGEGKAFFIANLLGIVAVAVTFFALYFFGATKQNLPEYRYAMVSSLAAGRVSAALFVSFIAFIILAGYPKDQSDFSRSFFMTHKAFFIALLYGIVIMGGTSGVAGAIKALLYRQMSSKVFMYIGTLSGFLAFSIFVGYFPDFRKGVVDEHRKVAQKQPRFVEILFEYIMIPIMLALTGVLILWTGKTIMGGMNVPFVRLSGIATSYAVGGIWLHIMATHYETGLAKFYRRVYPITALVILAFEAWALIIQLQKSGLKTTEYFFIVVWIATLASVVLLLIKKAKAHFAIAVITCGMAVLTILPFVGYHALPVTSQVSRLENLLLSQGMLKEGQIIPASTEPERSVREQITDSVNYLAYAENAKLPDWFDRNLRENAIFQSKLGFKKTWPEPDDIYGGNSREYMYTSLYLPKGAFDIGDYKWVINVQENYRKEDFPAIVQGDKGSYKIYWTVSSPRGGATLKITLDDQVILEQDTNDYIDRISKKYPPGQTDPQAGTFEDMSLQFETDQVKVLLVFNNIDINVNIKEDIIHYGLNLDRIYLKEK